MDDIAVAAGLGVFGIMLVYAAAESIAMAIGSGMVIGLWGFLFLNNWNP